MTDHGNSKYHAVVPHYHNWTGKVRDKDHTKPPEKWHKIANSDILKGDGNNE